MKKIQNKIDLDIQNPYDFTTIPNNADCQNWVMVAMQQQKQDAGVVLRFVDEIESANLNFTYRQKDSATNVLSFPFEMPDIPDLDEEPLYLGDLVLCEPVVLQEAIAQEKTRQQHWAHLIVHGMLHLQGYDHINDDDAIVMESLEVEILKSLGFDNPYESK